MDIASMATKASILDLNRPLSRMDIFYSGSTNKINGRTKQLENNDLKRQTYTSVNSENQQHKSGLYLSTAGLPMFDDENPTCGAATPLWSRSILSVSFF